MNARLELVIKVADRLTLALVFLRAVKVLKVSWWLVLSPVWLLALLALLILVVHTHDLMNPSRNIRTP